MGLENSDLLSIIGTLGSEGQVCITQRSPSTHRPTVLENSLDDEELIQQIPDLLVAGQDTTGNTLSWAFNEFANNQEWQDKVREEISELRVRTGGNYSYADLESLTSLNAHLKETLRFHPGLPLDTRAALKDAVIPLAEPVKTKDGRSLSEITVRKGQVIQCALASYNRFAISECFPFSHTHDHNPISRIEERWGADANTFNPLRWLGNGQKSSTGKSHAFGPYANLNTILQMLGYFQRTSDAPSPQSDSPLISTNDAHGFCGAAPYRNPNSKDQYCDDYASYYNPLLSPLPTLCCGSE
ncbi:cytochrome P450 [Marasmius fiardii PR-910]|nr:cytochrome P450 [Marasmius fiardii PR-910]